jgi:FkbM family methyltransferase
VRLHSFKHKGYWYRGTARERDTMIAFAQLVKPGDIVIEVGAHIGYIAMWLARLVGPTGLLIACEPGSNNLPYLRENLGQFDQASIREVAIAGNRGELAFMEEDFTGQNNSLLTDGEQLEATLKLAGMHTKTHIRTVQAVTLDDIVHDLPRAPALVKIDVEGGELGVMLGATKTLASDRPAIVIEVAFDHDAVEKVLLDAGYVVLDSWLRPMGAMRDLNLYNYVCLHRDRHADLLASLKFDAQWPSEGGT